MKSGELFDRFLSVLFPKRCVLCDDVVAYEDFWCGKCNRHEIGPETCGRCGKEPEYCACGEVEWGFSRTASPMRYKEQVRGAIISLKEGYDKRICAFLARQMAQTFSQRYSAAMVDCIVPVPMNESKLAARGYNQAELLARELEEMLRLPVMDGVLMRRDKTLSQHGLDRASRFQNAGESYAALSAEPVAGKRVLLVDDVMTTGATMHACACILRSAGAKEVYGLTAAGTHGNVRADI